MVARVPVLAYLRAGRLAHGLAGRDKLGQGHPGTPAPRHPGTPAPRTPAPRHPGTPAPRHPGTPAPRHPGTPAPRHPGTPAPRHPGTPAPRHPGTPARLERRRSGGLSRPFAVRAVAALAAALSLLLALAGSAQAQTSVTLVSNTGQATGANLRRDIDWATSFTTGPGQQGFKLTRVDIALARTNVPDLTYQVSIRADSEGRPDSSLGTLTNPTWSGSGTPELAQYSAPSGGIDLANETTYWVVVDVTDTNQGGFIWSTTASTDEDAGESLGWSIGNSRLSRTTGDWRPLSSSAHRVAIRGYSKDMTAPSIESVSVNRATLTMTFNEDLDPRWVPPGSSFSLQFESASPIAGTGTASISGDTVMVTLATALTPSDTPGRASYSPPSENGLRDGAGNLVVAQSYATVANNTPPAVQTATVSGATLSLAFDAALDTASVPDPGRFAVAGTDQATTVSGVAFASGDATTLELTLSPAVGAGDTGITLSYAQGDDDSPLQDAAEREVEDFAALAVANLMAMPAVSGVAFTNKPASAYVTIGAHIEVTVTFDQPVTVTGTPRIELSPAFGPGGETRYAEYVAGSPGAALVFRYALVAGDDTGGSSVSVPANGLDADGADGTASIRTGTMDAVTDHAAASSGLAVAAVRPKIEIAGVFGRPKGDADLDGTPDTFLKGEEIQVVLRLDDQITVANAGANGENVRIVVAVGGTDYALNVGSVSSTFLIFDTHTVVAADRDLDGITIRRDSSGNLVRLTGGATVRSQGSGNDADFSAAAGLKIRQLGVAGLPEVYVRGTNQAPAGSDFTRTTASDAGLALAAADFAIDDSEGDALKEIRVETLPAGAAGTLKLGGAAIAQAALPQTVTRTQLNAGSLAFDPVPAFSGSASFSFKVVDSLGAAAASANTATLNVYRRPSAVRAKVDGTLLEVVFDTALDADSSPPPGAFSVAGSGSGLQVPTAVAIERDLVSLTLGTAVAEGEKVVLGYLKPADDSGPLRDAAGVAAASFAGLQVVNVTGDATPPEVVQAWVVLNPYLFRQ